MWKGRPGSRWQIVVLDLWELNYPPFFILWRGFFGIVLNLKLFGQFVPTIFIEWQIGSKRFYHFRFVRPKFEEWKFVFIGWIQGSWYASKQNVHEMKNKILPLSTAKIVLKKNPSLWSVFCLSMQNGLRALAPRSTRILITDARLAERYCAQFYETDKRNKGYVSAAQKNPRNLATASCSAGFF